MAHCGSISKKCGILQMGDLLCVRVCVCVCVCALTQATPGPDPQSSIVLIIGLGSEPGTSLQIFLIFFLFSLFSEILVNNIPSEILSEAFTVLDTS